MFSIEELNRVNTRHGDLHGRNLDFIDPADLNPANFDGTGTLRVAIIGRDKLVNTLRRKDLDHFLTKPLEDFLPNPRDYDDRDRKERRYSKADTEEVKTKYRQTYFTMRAIVKPNSDCEAIISDADLECDVCSSSSCFSDQYLKTNSVFAAFNLILMFDKKPDERRDVLQAYIKLRKIVYRTELVKEGKDGTSNDETRTPAGRTSRLFSSSSTTITVPPTIATPRRDTVQAAFPECIWIFTILKKLKE